MAESGSSKTVEDAPGSLAQCFLCRVTAGGAVVRIIAALTVIGIVPTLSLIALLGALVCGALLWLGMRNQWTFAVSLGFLEWWFQCIGWAVFLGGAANFQFLILILTAVPLLLDNFSRKARLALAAGPVIVFLIDNWKLLEVSGVIELPFAAFYALSQFNLLLVIVGIAAVIFTFTRETLTQRQQAEQQAYSSRRLVANLSHELKTPITAILTTAQSMLRHERTSDKYKQALALCERNSRSMSHLIRRMLDLLDASPTSMGPALVDLDPRQILEACVELHAPLAMEKNVSLLMVCPKGHVIRTDADLLSIMLNNLVANAIRYTPSGKAVTLRFYHQPDKPATIRVSDQGPGIPKDALPHIFEAFYRVDRSSDRINGNYGLGLALTAQIAERIGAQLTVESDEESGALFCIQFPTSD